MSFRYEVLESETTHAEDEEQSNLAVEEESNGHDEPSTQSVLGSAAEAVIQVVKKAASALAFNNGMRGIHEFKENMSK